MTWPTMTKTVSTRLQSYRKAITRVRQSRQRRSTRNAACWRALCGLHLSHWERSLRRRQQNETGEFNLTFANFNEEFNSFPFLLGAANLGGKKLHTDASCLLPALFKDFEKVPFVVAYEAFFAKMQKRAHGRTIGLVFPRKGIPKGLVIHNKSAERLGYEGLQAIYLGRERSLYVRTFRGVLEALDRGGHGQAADSLREE